MPGLNQRTSPPGFNPAATAAALRSLRSWADRQAAGALSKVTGSLLFALG